MITKKDLIDAIDDLEKRVQSLEEIINNKKLKELLNDYNEISLKDLADFTNAFGLAVLKVDDKVNDIKTKVEKDLDRTKIYNESFKREIYEYVKTNIEKIAVIQILCKQRSMSWISTPEEVLNLIFTFSESMHCSHFVI